MIKLLIGLSLLVSSSVFGQSSEIQETYTISVTVTNITSEDGQIGLALYDKDNFMRAPLQVLNGSIDSGESFAVFKNIAPGRYAIAAMHDKNSNNQMDFDSNGMPLEDYGMSNNIMTYGPPEFEISAFNLRDESLQMEIKF
jgi:uncharacterized protein (DUF2141 family)